MDNSDLIDKVFIAVCKLSTERPDLISDVSLSDGKVTYLIDGTLDSVISLRSYIAGHLDIIELQDTVEYVYPDFESWHAAFLGILED
jgi:hypothetical protein